MCSDIVNLKVFSNDLIAGIYTHSIVHFTVCNCLTLPERGWHTKGLLGFDFFIRFKPHFIHTYSLIFATAVTAIRS